MNLIDRAKNMLLSPKTEWLKVNNETGSLGTLVPSYTLPLAAVGAAGFFLGWGLLAEYSSIKLGLIIALIYLIAAVLTVVITTFIADALAPSMGGEKNMVKSTQWVVYGLTPMCLSLILGIIPGADLKWLILIAGFGFSFYVMMLGAPLLKKTAADKTVPYTAVVVGAALVVFIIIERIEARLFRDLI